MSQISDNKSRYDDSNRSKAVFFGRMTFAQTTTFKLILTIVFLDMIATGLVVPTIPYIAKRLNLDASMQGSLMSLYGILQLSSSTILGKISDRFGRKYLMLLSIGGTLLSYTFLINSCDITFLFISRVIVGLLKSTETSCYAMVTDISSPSVRVKRMSLVGSAVGLGFIVGPALSGFLTSHYSLEFPTYCSCILLFLTFILTVLFLPESKSFSKTHISPQTSHKTTLRDHGSPKPSHNNHSNPHSQNSSLFNNTNNGLHLNNNNSSFNNNNTNNSSLINNASLNNYDMNSSLNNNKLSSSPLAFSSDSLFQSSNNPKFQILPFYSQAGGDLAELEGANDELIDQLALPASFIDEEGGEGIQLSNINSNLIEESDGIDSNRSSLDSHDSLRSSLNHSSDSTQPTRKLHGLSDLIKLLLYPNSLSTLIWVYFLSTMGLSVFQGSSSILLQMLGLSVQVSSWVTSYSGFLSVISSFVLHFLNKYWTDMQLVTRSVIVLTVALIWTSLSFPTLVGLLIVWVPLILGSRILKNCLLGLITHQTHHSQTGTIIGLMNSLESLCRALAPLIGGVLMQYSLQLPSLAGGMFTFVTLLIILFSRNASKQDIKNEA